MGPGQAYGDWLGARLPSEAEWEYVASSRGEQRQYPWGDQVPTCDYAVMQNVNGLTGCGLETTAQTCSRSPAGDTEEGVCDMAGNVFEWVEDDYHANYFGAPCDAYGSGFADCGEAQGDEPIGSAWVDVPRGNKRVYRGGGFLFDETFMLVRERRSYRPDFRVNYLGFRVATFYLPASDAGN